MSFHHVFQNIPNHRLLAVYNLLGWLHGLHDTAFYELTDDERLIKFCGHQFRQTTFSHLQLRSYNDNRTGWIVHTLTQQVLTETALLTFQRIGKGLQRTVGIRLYRTGLAGVVEQAVHGLLQHTFLITQNHLGSFDFNQSLQTVVTNNDTTIQVVQVGSGKTAAIQRNQRTQFGRNHRKDFHNHPFRLIASPTGTERLNHLQPLQGFGLTLLSRIGIGTVTQFVWQFIQIQTEQKVINGLCTHLGYELIRVRIIQILVLFGKFLQIIQIFIFGQQVIGCDSFFGQHARLNDYITFVVNDCIQLLCRYSQQITDFVR